MKQKETKAAVDKETTEGADSMKLELEAVKTGSNDKKATDEPKSAESAAKKEEKTTPK